jgi:acyl-CoA reductase-like NAD-dependent aldehyde dehydrogenase
MAATEIFDPVREFLAADTHALLIDGQRVPAADGRTFDTPDPSTGERLATVSHGGAEDVDRAVAAARRAFADGSEWRRMSPADRGRRLASLAALIEMHADELAQLESLQSGRSLPRWPLAARPCSSPRSRHRLVR